MAHCLHANEKICHLLFTDYCLLYFTLLYFTLLYFTLLYFTLLYSVLYFTSLHFTLLYFSLLLITCILSLYHKIIVLAKMRFLDLNPYVSSLL